MPLRNWQQHAEPASAPPAIDGARGTGQPVLPRGRVLGVNECVSQGLSSQKRHPAELDNVDQLIYDMCGRRRLQVSAWLRPADAAALLLDGQKVLAYCTPRTPSAAHYAVAKGSARVCFRSEGSACGGVRGPRVVCLVLLAGSASLSSGSCLLRNTSVERTRSLP